MEASDSLIALVLAALVILLIATLSSDGVSVGENAVSAIIKTLLASLPGGG